MIKFSVLVIKISYYMYIFKSQSLKSKLNYASFLYIPDYENLVSARPDMSPIFIDFSLFYGISYSDELSSSDDDCLRLYGLLGFG